MGGAGTRTIKMRGGMGLLGVLGKYGMYRLNNSMALLDAKVRGVSPEEAKAGRNFSNYTWHGDQAPGHPWVHGLQASDCDFNDLRFSKLIIMDGKNLVENKLTDSHWFIETMERGGKIVVIAPEYGPPSTKADYWIPIRPQTDAALFLGITRLMMEKKQFDPEFVKAFTDFPLLVRTDTLKRLRAHEVFPGYADTLSPDGPSIKIQGLTKEQHAQARRLRRLGREGRTPRAVTRDDVGKRMATSGISPALEGRYKVKLADGQTVECATLWTLYQVHLKDYDLDTVADITRCAEGSDRAPGRRHRDHQAGGHPPGRGHQPLVPRHRDEPGGLPAAHAHRQHRQAGRGLPHLGRQLQGRALPGLALDRTRLQGLGGRGPVPPDPRRERARQGGPRPRLHQGRGAGLLEPRRQGA